MTTNLEINTRDAEHTTPDEIETIFLCEECQSAEDVAELLAGYLRRAERTIDFCIYSFHLCPEAQEIFFDALKDRAAAGVEIRIAYDAGRQQSALGLSGHYTCDISTGAFAAEMGFQAKAIEGERALMHHKYIVIDNGTPNAQVWTGSTNFTDASWTIQDNNIIILHSEAIAELYTEDFNELWADGLVDATSNYMDSGEATLQYKGEPAHVLVNFSPSEGEWMDDMVAAQVSRTQECVTLAFVVLTSGDILQAMHELMRRGVPIEGVYDYTQMEGVKYQWEMVPDNHWKIGAFQEIVEYGNLVGKNSTPYTPTSKHDFQHNKVMVLDGVTITGSYNFSRHAQVNAENLLVIASTPLAETYREYIYTLMRKYRGDVPAKPPARPTKTTPPAPDT